MKKGDIIVALGGIGISGIMFTLSSAFPPIVDGSPGPGFWPKMLSLAMGLLSISLLVQTVLKSKKEKTADSVAVVEEKQIDYGSPAMKRVYCMIGAGVAYAVLVAITGFIIGSVLFIPAGMWVMGERSKRNIALLTGGVVLFIVVIFLLIFKMPLPMGIFFH